VTNLILKSNKQKKMKKRKLLLLSLIRIWLLGLVNGEAPLTKRVLRSLLINTRHNLEKNTHMKSASKFWKKWMRTTTIIGCLIFRDKASRMHRSSSKRKLKTLRGLQEQRDSLEVLVMGLIHRIWYTFSTLET